MDDYTHYRPAHSDFLIHWTGSHIAAGRSGLSNPAKAKQYIDCLKSILRYGLWMTVEKAQDAAIKTQKRSVKVGSVVRTCFTELKLSEIRAHAQKFGLLGIGFKRFFVIERGGMPMWYYPRWSKNPVWRRMGIEKTIAQGQLAAFLKTMGTNTKNPTYEFYDESEWRIVYSANLTKVQVKRPNKGFRDYFEKLRKKKRPQYPEYLLPVKSRWLAMIIYPDIGVRYEAQKDKELQNLLLKAKKEPVNGRPPRRPNGKEPGDYEYFIPPLQLDLDDCRNF